MSKRSPYGLPSAEDVLAAEISQGHVWIDLETGRPMEPGASGAVKMAIEDLPIDRRDGNTHDLDWLGDSYTRSLASVEGELAAVADTAEEAMRECQAKLAWLRYRYGDRLRACVNYLAQKRKVKRWRFSAGTAGYDEHGKFYVKTGK